MAARKRTPWYVGPKVDIARADLAALDARGRHVIEEKHDGVWARIEVVAGRLVSAESRVGLPHGSAEFGGLEGLQLFPAGFSGVLVAELVADWGSDKWGEPERSGTRRLFFFDFLVSNGVDIRDESAEQRRAMLEVLWDARVYLGDLAHLVRQERSGFVEFFDEIIARGGEGIVAKAKASKHRAHTADGKISDWVRCKPRRTVDYIVTGHGRATKGTPNLTLALVRDGQAVDVMKTSIPKRFGHIAPEAWVGQVVEVLGQEMWPSGALRFGDIVRPRTDKRPEDCTYEAATLAARVSL